MKFIIQSDSIKEQISQLEHEIEFWIFQRGRVASNLKVIDMKIDIAKKAIGSLKDFDLAMIEISNLPK